MAVTVLKKSQENIPLDNKIGRPVQIQIQNSLGNNLKLKFKDSKGINKL